MHLATDYIHPTPRGGKCRIRIYLSEDKQDAAEALDGSGDGRGARGRVGHVGRRSERPLPQICGKGSQAVLAAGG